MTHLKIVGLVVVAVLAIGAIFAASAPVPVMHLAGDAGNRIGVGAEPECAGACVRQKRGDVAL